MAENPNDAGKPPVEAFGQLWTSPPKFEQARDLLIKCSFLPNEMSKLSAVEQYEAYDRCEFSILQWNKLRGDFRDQRWTLSARHLYENQKERVLDLSGRVFPVQMFFAIDLQECYLTGAILTDTSLSWANMRGAKLMGAQMKGAKLAHANLEGAILDTANLDDAEITNARLSGASLRDTSVRGANLNGCIMEKTCVTGIKYDRKQLEDKCRGVYFGGCFGGDDFIRDAGDEAFISREKVKRIEELRERWNESCRLFWSRDLSEPIWPITEVIPAILKMLSFLLWSTIDYGRSYWRVAGWALVIALVFGIIFCIDQDNGWGLIDYYPSDECPPPTTVVTPFYFSVVTLTTLGFGDIRPENWVGQIIVALEVICGYTVLGLFIAVFGKSVARRAS